MGQHINRARNYYAKNYNKFRVDTNKIILIGSSAGAEAVLHAAYWPACLVDNIKSEYAGLISMAGAINSLSYIRRDNIIPMLLFHGTCDDLVPFGTAPHHYCDKDAPGYLMLHGSAAIADHAKKLGSQFYLFMECGGGHEWSSRPFEYGFGNIVDFSEKDIIQQQSRQIRHVEYKDKTCEQYPRSSYCDDN